MRQEVRPCGQTGVTAGASVPRLMETPDAHTLSKVDWQFWITLTFKSESSTEKLRQSLWFSLLRDVAGWWRVDFRRLLWIRRTELGEMTERLHYHALLGGLPTESVNRPTCFSIKNDWERLGGGMARVYVYARDRNALHYVLDADFVTSRGAAQHEASKYGKTSSVTCSEGVLRLITQRQGGGRRLRARRQSVDEGKSGSRCT